MEIKGLPYSVAALCRGQWPKRLRHGCDHELRGLPKSHAHPSARSGAIAAVVVMPVGGWRGVGYAGSLPRVVESVISS